ncbi:MAG: lipid A biosynthesis acyltransferase [Thiobacillus sp.]
MRTHSYQRASTPDRNSPSAMLSRLAVFLLWLLHGLPLPLLAAIGRGLGWVLFRVAGRRRRIVEINLSLCFPELDDTQRRRLAQAHFQVLARSMLERGMLWWSRPERLQRLIRVEGADTIRELLDAGRPIMLLAPHFVGLDAGGVGIAMRFDCASLYAEQSSKVFNRLLYQGRKRFGDQLLLSRDENLRTIVRAMKAGRPFYYLPDVNFRTRDSIFVPFFGVPAATVSGLSRLAKLTGAAVVPCATRMLPGGQGYVVEVGQAWDSYPTDDVEADTRRMNAWIEEAVRTMPEQYYWVHRRFKTRPAGEPPLY